MPRSQARARTAGEAIGRRGGSARRRAPAGGAAPGCVAVAPGAGAAALAARRGDDAGFAAAAAPPTCAARRRRSTSMRISSAPTASICPTSPPSASTLPATGDGISTVALSVITSASVWSSATTSPGFTCQATSSTSAMPSPMSGMHVMFSHERRSIDVTSAAHRFAGPLAAPPGDAAGARGDHASIARCSAATRAGPGKVGPFLGMRIGRVPAGDALDRRLEVVEAMLLHQRRPVRRRSRWCGWPRARRRSGRSSCTEATMVVRSSGHRLRRSMISASMPLSAGRGLAHEDHRAVGQHRHVAAGPEHRGRVERHRVMALGHLAHGVRRPGHHRLVVVAVERAVVEALGLEKDHRVVVLDRGDQQALGVVGVGRHHGAQAADMREQRLRALAVGLAAVDAAAAGHADRDRRGEVAGRAVAQARRLGDDLVGGRVEVVGELDLDHRAQAVGAPCRRPRRRCRLRRSARRTRATCRTSSAGPRCSGTRRRNSRRPGRRRRRCRRARASRPWPSAAPGSWSCVAMVSILRRLAQSACRAGAPACPCRHPRTSWPAAACGRRPASRTSRPPSAPRRPAASRSLRVASCSSSDQAPRPIRCCFRRSIGSPSGKRSASRRRGGSGGVVRGRMRRRRGR